MASNFPLVDIFVTTFRRPELLKLSLKSLNDSIDVTKTPFRLSLIVDGVLDGDKTLPVAMEFQKEGLVDHLVTHRENLGLGPSINQALGHIQSLNEWHRSRSEYDRISEFVCYCQDDLIYSHGWLESMMQWFAFFENIKKLGFASGVECVEHKVKEELGTFANQRIVTKDWIRAANMFARREYWMSMCPIPGMDPETGRLRAKPNDGMGSGVDWWFIRNHDNSVCKTGRTCLVLPGLIKHAGYKKSTWLSRELPESQTDKDSIQYELGAPKTGDEVELVECDTYGCRELKKKNAVFCKSCWEDYQEDPDAYK